MILPVPLDIVDNHIITDSRPIPVHFIKAVDRTEIHDGHKVFVLSEVYFYRRRDNREPCVGILVSVSNRPKIVYVYSIDTMPDITDHIGIPKIGKPLRKTDKRRRKRMGEASMSRIPEDYSAEDYVDEKPTEKDIRRQIKKAFDHKEGNIRKYHRRRGFSPIVINPEIPTIPERASLIAGKRIEIA